MGFLMGLMERRSAASVMAGMAEYARSWLDDSLGGGETAAGISVSPEDSLGYSAVLACVRVLAEGVASLPCLVYERYLQDGREAKRRAPEHPVYDLLHNAPNRVMTAFELYEMGMAQVLLWGNFYAEIEWDRRGQVVGLWPLPAWRVTPVWGLEGKTYLIQVSAGNEVALSDYQVLHVPSFGYDGVSGKSLITMAREAVGLGLATQRYGSAFFGNGARPGVVLEHPGKLSDEAHKRLRESWEARHQGLSNAQRVAVLEEGMKMETIGIPPEDAQFLETRKYQRSEIASIFRVPPHMIGDLERATFSNIEQQSTDFYTNTLQPWLRRWEQRLIRSLLKGTEKTKFFIEFLVDALLRGDTTARYGAYAVGRQWGWLSVNDIRQRENMNPVDGGEGYLVPLNMGELGEEDGARSETGPSEEEEGARSETGPSEEGETGPSEGTGPSEEREARGMAREMRQVRSAGSRRKLAKSYRGTLEHVGQRIVNREVNDIRQASKRFLGEGNLAGFEVWSAGFDLEHSAFVREYLDAPLQTYLRLVVAEVERELDVEIDAAEVAPFGVDYISGRSNEWMAELRRRMRRASRRPDDVDVADWDAVASVDEWLDGRKEKKAGMFALDETVRGGNAMAIAVYALAGVLRKVWRSFGEACPLCTKLDGWVVGIDQPFIGANQGLSAGESSYSSMSDVGHPPMHDGCDCMVVAE